MEAVPDDLKVAVGDHGMNGRGGAEAGPGGVVEVGICVSGVVAGFNQPGGGKIGGLAQSCGVKGLGMGAGRGEREPQQCSGGSRRKAGQATQHAAQLGRESAEKGEQASSKGIAITVTSLEG